MENELRERCFESGVFDYENSVSLADKLKTAQAAVIEVSKALDVSNVETTEEEDQKITAVILLLTDLGARNKNALNAFREKFARPFEEKT